MNDCESVVYIVDDDEAVRDSLEVLLTAMQVPTRSYSSAAEFLENYSSDQAGCLILDVRMAGMSGLELQRVLKRRHALLPVIFITGHGDVEGAVVAMQAGAVDYLQKPFNEQKLLDTVFRCLQEDRRNRERLAERNSLRAAFETLTPREHEVMQRVVEGQPNKVIAIDLGVSERTVELHRARVMKKTRASSLAHLVRMVLELEERRD